MRCFAIAFVLFVAAAAGLSAQDAKIPESALKEWNETIDYGIDNQIIDVVKKIEASGDGSFNVKLTGVLAKSVNPTLRKEILTLFTANKFAGAEAVGYTILINYEDEDAEVLRALVAYLAEIKSKRSLDYMIKLMDVEDNVVAYSAITALGQMGDAGQAALLLKKLLDPEMRSDRKPTIIIALGDMKSKEALPELLKIVANRNEDHVWRMYAAEALGKIGDPSAVPALKKLMGENDPLVKSYAAAALGKFDLATVMDVLLECLKDSYWKVRVSACQALAQPGAAKAVDILIYKVNNDPETPVKSEAVKALAAIGAEPGFVFLRTFLADRGKPADLRQLILTTLLDKNLNAQTAAAVEKTIKAEWDNSGGFLEWAAQQISKKTSPFVRGALVALLDHPNPLVKTYAIRGVGANRFLDLKPKLQDMAKNDRLDQVKKEAQAALDKM